MLLYNNVAGLRQLFVFNRLTSGVSWSVPTKLQNRQKV